MAINDDLLNEIKYDFRIGPDSHNLNISQTEYNDFWDWFSEHALEFTSENNHNDINSTLDYNAGNCFGNAQSISLRNNKDYCEGFIFSQNSYKLHGFNLENDNVNDYTVSRNPDEYVDNNGNLPTQYVGVIIPQDFIRENRNADITDNYLNIDPLLLDFFRSRIR